MNDKQRGIANMFLDACKKEKLTYTETHTLLQMIEQRIHEAKVRDMENVGMAEMNYEAFY